MKVSRRILEKSAKCSQIKMRWAVWTELRWDEVKKSTSKVLKTRKAGGRERGGEEKLQSKVRPVSQPCMERAS